MTLNVNTEQSSSLDDTQIQLQLHDKAQKIIPHSSLLITIKNQNETVLDDLFHTHSGLLTMILKQNSNTTQWVLGDGNEKMGIGWVNDNGKYILSTLPIKKTETYEVNISVFNVYDDTFSFKPNEKPMFNFAITSDESGHISKLITELKQRGSSYKSENISVPSLSPIKQFKSGLEINQIVCKKGQVLAIKTSDSLPACVKPETKQMLIERGWAKPI